MLKFRGEMKRPPKAQKLWAAYVKALNQTVFNAKHVADHLIRQEISIEVMHDLAAPLLRGPPKLFHLNIAARNRTASASLWLPASALLEEEPQMPDGAFGVFAEMRGIEAERTEPAAQ